MIDGKILPRRVDNIVFVEGMGVFMEEFKRILECNDIHPVWILILGKSIRSTDPGAFERDD